MGGGGPRSPGFCKQHLGTFLPSGLVWGDPRRAWMGRTAEMPGFSPEGAAGGGAGGEHRCVLSGKVVASLPTRLEIRATGPLPTQPRGTDPLAPLLHPGYPKPCGTPSRWGAAVGAGIQVWLNHSRG